MGKKNGYVRNRGKICITPGCNNKARIKLKCMNCYQNGKSKQKLAAIA